MTILRVTICLGSRKGIAARVDELTHDILGAPQSGLDAGVEARHPLTPYLSWNPPVQAFELSAPGISVQRSVQASGIVPFLSPSDISVLHAALPANDRSRPSSSVTDFPLNREN